MNYRSKARSELIKIAAAIKKFTPVASFYSFLYNVKYKESVNLCNTSIDILFTRDEYYCK